MNRREFMQWCAAIATAATGPKLLSAKTGEDSATESTEIGDFASLLPPEYVTRFSSANLRIGMDVGQDVGVFCVSVPVKDVLILQPMRPASGDWIPFYAGCSLPHDDKIIGPMHKLAQIYSGHSSVSVLEARMSWLLTGVKTPEGERLGHDIIIEGLWGTYYTEMSRGKDPWTIVHRPRLSASPIPLTKRNDNRIVVRPVAKDSEKINKMDFWRSGVIGSPTTIYYALQEAVSMDSRSKIVRGQRFSGQRMVNSWGGSWSASGYNSIKSDDSHFPVPEAFLQNLS